MFTIRFNRTNQVINGLETARALHLALVGMRLIINVTSDVEVYSTVAERALTYSEISDPIEYKRAMMANVHRQGGEQSLRFWNEVEAIISRVKGNADGTCDACADAESIAVAGDSIHCRSHRVAK